MTTATVPSNRSPRIKPDSVLIAAIEFARGAALEEAEHAQDVGEHVGATMLGDRFAMHKFECTMRGYVGWHWSVTIARAPRARVATICEVALLPSEHSILAPEWLPWSERLQPGDIGPGDVLPFRENDPRLVPGYVATGNEDEDRVAIEELALARARILSETGRDEAAKRWYEGSQGPRSAGSLQSAASCGSCGFLVKLQGSLGQVFGVCSNAWSDDDGKVVALGHGCGAHSETDVAHRASEWPDDHPIIDELSIEQVAQGELESLAPASDADRAGDVEKRAQRIALAAQVAEAAKSAHAAKSERDSSADSEPTALQSADTHSGKEQGSGNGASQKSGRRGSRRSDRGSRDRDHSASDNEQSSGPENTGHASNHGSTADSEAQEGRAVLDVIAELRTKSREQAREERNEQRAEKAARQDVSKTLDSIAASIGEKPAIAAVEGAANGATPSEQPEVSSSANTDGSAIGQSRPKRSRRSTRSAGNAGGAASAAPSSSGATPTVEGSAPAAGKPLTLSDIALPPAKGERSEQEKAASKRSEAPATDKQGGVDKQQALFDLDKLAQSLPQREAPGSKN